MPAVEDRQLLKSAPYFPVADVDRSASHYKRVLGFSRDYTGGTPRQFAIVSRDGALHAELQAKGAEIVYGPIVQDAYGMEEFAVRDSDGYVLGFGQPLGTI